MAPERCAAMSPAIMLRIPGTGTCLSCLAVQKGDRCAAPAGSGDKLRLQELCMGLAGSQMLVRGPQIPGLDCAPMLESVLVEMQQHRELERLVLELRSSTTVPMDH